MTRRSNDGRRGRHGGIVVGMAALLTVALMAASSPAWGAAPTLLAKTDGNDVNAAVGRNFLVWSSGRDAQQSYHILAQRNDGTRFRVNPLHTAGFPGGLRGNALAFQQIESFQSNLWWVNLRTGDRRGLGDGVNTRDWEWRVTVSGQWLLFGREGDRFTEVWLMNIDTRELQRLAVADFYQGQQVVPGQVNGRYAVWTRETPSGWDVTRYNIETGNRTVLDRPATVFGQYAASVTSDGTVYMARSRDGGCGTNVKLVRHPLGGDGQVLAALPPGADFNKSYAYETASGAVRIVFGMNTGCESNADVYQVIDDGQSGPIPFRVPGSPSAADPNGTLRMPDAA